MQYREQEGRRTRSWCSLGFDRQRISASRIRDNTNTITTPELYEARLWCTLDYFSNRSAQSSINLLAIIGQHRLNPSPWSVSTIDPAAKRLPPGLCASIVTFRLHQIVRHLVQTIVPTHPFLGQKSLCLGQRILASRWAFKPPPSPSPRKSPSLLFRPFPCLDQSQGDFG